MNHGKMRTVVTCQTRVVTCQTGGWSHVKRCVVTCQTGGGHMSNGGWSHVKRCVVTCQTGGHPARVIQPGSSSQGHQLKITHTPLVFCFCFVSHHTSHHTHTYLQLQRVSSPLFRPIHFLYPIHSNKNLFFHATEPLHRTRQNAVFS